MWNKGYNDRLRLLNTQNKWNIDVYIAESHNYFMPKLLLLSNIGRIVLCFQLLSNGFNSQLVSALIKSTDNRTRGHNVKLIKQSCSVDAIKYYFTNRVINSWNSLPSDIISSPTLTTFKSRLLQHDISSHLIMFTVYRLFIMLH